MTNEINAHSLSSYSVEERAFHRTFPDLPESEKLIQSCSCCISRRQLMRLGKLYITSLRFCFTSPFLQKPLIVPWEFVVGISTKENFVMDTITVVDKEEQTHIFSAFFGGRTSQIYSLMHTLWSVRQRITANNVKINYNVNNREGEKNTENACHNAKSGSKLLLEANWEKRYNAVSSSLSESSSESSLSTSLTSSTCSTRDVATPRPPSQQREIVTDTALGAKANKYQKRRQDGNVITNELAFTDSNKANGDEGLCNDLLSEKKQVETKTELAAFVDKEHWRGNIGNSGECGWEQRVRLLSPELLPGEKKSSEFYNNQQEEQQEQKVDRNNQSKEVLQPKLKIKGNCYEQQESETMSLNSDNITLSPKKSRQNALPLTENQNNAEIKMEAFSKTTQVTNEKETKLDEETTRRMPKVKELQKKEEECHEVTKLMNKEEREAVERSSASIASFSPRERQSFERDKSLTPLSPSTTSNKNWNNNKKNDAQAKSEAICNSAKNNNGNNDNTILVAQNANKTTRSNSNESKNNGAVTSNTNEHSPLKTLPLSRSTSNLNVEADKAEEKAELLQLFPFLPQTEILLHSFACSYISGIHRIGKMYITTNYILFNSFMLTEPLQIHFHNVKAVIKLQTMMILDGVSLRLSNDRSITFTNFVSRDTAFNALSSAKVSFDEKEREQTTELVTNDQLVINDKLRDCNQNVSDNLCNMFKTSTSEPVFNKISTASSEDAFSSLVTDYDTSFSPISAFTTEILAPVPLPVGKTIFDVFRCCFDDDAPVLPEYNKERNYSDEKYSKWRNTADDGSFCGQRVFDCTSVIRAMMNKQCHLTQYEKYAFYKVNDKAVLMIQTSGQISNVMLADAFRVESLMTFTQANSVGTDSATVVMMHVRSHIHFFRSVLLKGKIVSNANNELKEGMKKLFNLLFKYLSEMKKIERVSSSLVEELQPTPPVLENEAHDENITQSLSPSVVQEETVNFEPYVHLPMELNNREWRYVIFVTMVFIAITCAYGIMVNLYNKPLHLLLLNGHYRYNWDNAFFELVAHSSALLHSIGLFIGVQLAFFVFYTHFERKLKVM